LQAKVAALFTGDLGLFNPSFRLPQAIKPAVGYVGRAKLLFVGADITVTVHSIALVASIDHLPATPAGTQLVN
jgi:hypothetical protein